ncbi:unnamed protein product [Penicillium pancosmium]
MRATPASLVGLTLLSGLANAQSAYDNICSTAPVGEQDVEPGIVATYECETWHHTGHYAQSSVTATTPEICASECAKRSPEGPCTWYTNTCYFYNAGAPTVAAVAPDSEAVSINTRKDWNKLKVAYDTLEADYNTCESDKSVLNSQLATCQANLGTGGPPGGSGGPPGGSGGPPGGSGGPPSSIPLSVAACPGSTNALITHGGRDWKLVCKKRKNALMLVQETANATGVIGTKLRVDAGHTAAPELWGILPKTLFGTFMSRSNLGILFNAWQILVVFVNLSMIDNKGIKRNGMFHFSACGVIQLAIGFGETVLFFLDVTHFG